MNLPALRLSLTSNGRASSFTAKRLLSTISATQSARNQCLNLLKKHDLPSYMQVGYIPKSAQDAFIALHAFNVDIARIGDSTTSEAVALLRMKFWRDTIDKALAGSPPQEPSAVLLAASEEDLRCRTNGQFGLKKTWLHRMIMAREQQVANKPFSTLESLEAYAENTYSTMFYLVLSALQLQSVTADHVASHIGKAAGITAVLRGVPILAFPAPISSHHHQRKLGASFHSASQGSVLLPLDILAKCGVQEEQVLRLGPSTPNLKDAILDVATRANDHLITAREMIQNSKQRKEVGHEYEQPNEYVIHDRSYGEPELQKQLQEVNRAFPALLAAVNIKSWLGMLEKKNFDIFHPRVRKMNWKLPISLFIAMMQHKI